MNVHVAPHTRAKPYASIRKACRNQGLAALKLEREAHFQAEMKKLERALNRLVAFNCRSG